MTDKTQHEPGTFSWADLGTIHIADAKRFYTGLFGWEAEDLPAGDAGTYTMFRKGGKDVAAAYEQGDNERSQQIPPHWNAYVTVDDIGARAKAVERLGGKLLAEPFDVLEAGRMAVIQDPSGAVVSLWEPRRQIGAQVMHEPGSLTWTEVLTRDVDAARAFYTELFEWSSETSDIGGASYTLLKFDDEPRAGLMGIRPEWGEMPPHWITYFASADCDADARAAEELGGRTLTGPQDIPGVGRFAALADPQGASFSILASG